VNDLGLYLVWVILGVTAHELAHAAVARAFGGTVRAVTIGQGPVLARFRVVRLPMVVRLIPLSGLTEWGGPPASRRGPRLAVSLAGCALNLACALGGLLAGARLSSPLGSFVLANGLLGIYNLMPLTTAGGGSLDGLAALRLLRPEVDPFSAQSLERARSEPRSAHAERVRDRLRALVDQAGHVRAAATLATLPSGEPGRELRPATADLARLYRLATAPALPVAVRAHLATLLATSGAPGHTAVPVPALPPAEAQWVDQLGAYARSLATAGPPPAERTPR
jgi:hypothetical protein